MPLSVLLWPPFLAGIIAGNLMVIPILMLPASVDATSWLARAMQIVFTLVLIPLFWCSYFRQLPDDRRAKLEVDPDDRGLGASPSQCGACCTAHARLSARNAWRPDAYRLRHRHSRLRTAFDERPFPETNEAFATAGA